MTGFTTHTGVGVPLRRSNVDTDQIIPAVFLKRVSRTGFGDGLFAAWRTDPDFVLNQPAYQGGSVLVAGQEFGTGSSREHAVWALQDYGFAVVLAPRFADIFRGNAGKRGLVAGTISHADTERIWNLLEASPGTEITVDLTRRTATVADTDGDAVTIPFEIDDHTRSRLLAGHDEIAATLRHVDKIAAFERRREDWRPETLPARHWPHAEVVSARGF